GRVLGGVEEVGAAQVVVELAAEGLQARQRQGHFHAGGGDVVGVVDQGAFHVAEVGERVGEAEVAPLGQHVGVGRIEVVGDGGGEGGAGEGGQYGGEQGLAHGVAPWELRGRLHGSTPQTMRAASSKDSRGERGYRLAGSP